MSGPVPSRVSLQVISSPLLIAGGLCLLMLLGVLQAESPFHPALGPWGRFAALLPLILVAVLIILDGIQRVDITPEGIGVVTFAGLFLKKVLRFGVLQAGRTFRLPWSLVDAVEIRIPRFQSPFRRAVPRGWLVAGSGGRMVRIPFGHPRFGAAVAMLRRCVHPYFLHLPSREWEGKFLSRPALARMLRTVIYDPATPPEFIAETARGCLLWGNFTRAERLMDLALAKTEENLQVMDDYYMLMKRLGNLEKAKPALERLLASRRAPLDLLERAEVHLAEGQEKEATERLLQALEEDQTSGLAHFLLGCIYLQREGLEETALDQWRKGLERARHPHVAQKLGENYQYHRDLLSTAGFLEREHRRLKIWLWSQRLGAAGISFVLGGMGLWWVRPESAFPFPGISGSALFLGGALMLAALYLRRKGRP